VPTPCPICAHPSPTIGPIVHNHPTAVAGVTIDLGDTVYTMQRCPNCGLGFKDPPIPMDALIACYAQAKEDHWEHAPSPRKRRFDDLALCITANAAGKRILDVGCSNGALLDYLQKQDRSWDCFGLEPGEAAAEIATERGITILGAFFDDLDPNNPEHLFDVIIAIDVLEHLPDPKVFMEQAASHLATGGIFVALTGDTDAWGWRLQGSRYWYCNLPEHLVFYSRPTIEYFAEKFDLELVDYQRISHMRSKISRTVRDLIRNTIWGICWRAKGFGIPPLRRSLNTNPPPGWLPNRDHMLFVLRSRAQR
jgi:SAM-dependent methyltransferase